MTLAAPARPRAFTLIEAVASMVVISVLAGLAWRLVLTSVGQSVDASARLAICDEVSAALERAVDQLRQVPAKAGVTPAAPNITGVTATSVSWLGASGAPVSLALDAGRLVLTEGAQATVLARDVTAFGVRTFDHADTRLALSLAGAACESVRRVELTLTASRRGVSETLRTRVFLRRFSPGG